MSRAIIPPVVHEYLEPGSLAEALRRDVLAGLADRPRSIPPKWFYDERGSELFDQITRLDEYYPTRAERSILGTHAAAVVELSGASMLVELGSGTADKTRVILDELMARCDRPTYVPFDVSPEFLRDSAVELAHEYPGLAVEGVVGDLDRHLDRLPGGSTRLVAFLGGTVGNYHPGPRAELLADIAAAMEPGDHFLLGTDLVKSPDCLVAAYDDALGVTADFNRNVLRVVNRELDADFDVDAFEHVARWDADEEWMSMSLRSTVDQQVRINALDVEFEVEAGEEIHTEISAKFRPDGVVRELAAVGFDVVRQCTDELGDFAVTLAVKR